MLSKRPLLLLAAVASTGLIAAGCGNNEDQDTTATAKSGGTSTQMESGSSTETKTTSADGTETGSSELRATLTHGLEEHVYLAGIAVKMGVDNGLDSAQFKAAAGTLDENSKALSDAIGSVYGDDAGKQFLALWRAHIGMFVEYTKGKATKNPKLVKKAAKDLDGYRTEFGAFLESANPNLSQEAVAEELKPHVASLAAAVDAVVAGSPSAFNKLRKAASHMPNTAAVLAGGIAKQMPDKFSGDSASGASELRSLLTAQLTEHVYLAGIAVTQGVGEGLDSKAFAASAGTLDKNSKALAKSIESVYGADAGKQFLALWRAHIGFFVEYTKAKATKNAKGAAKAQKKLDGYRTEFGAFLESANPNLTQAAVAEELKPHVASLSAAIDSVVAGKGDAFDKLREAASHMPQTANVLAGAIVKQSPEKF
jgi:cytochrome c556